jgi:hypothetical protein
MAPLKWARLPVRDTGPGMSGDILEPDMGSPIMAVQNGFIGPDGMPHPKLFSWRPTVPAGTNIPGTTKWALGEGPPVNGDNTPQNDANGNPSAMRYAVQGMPGINKTFAIFRGVNLLSTDVQSISSLTPDPQPCPGMLGLNIRNDRAGLYSNPFFGASSTPPVMLVGGDLSQDVKVPNGIPIKDTVAYPVVAKGTIQQIGSSYTGPTNCGVFVLYLNATRWFLTKVAALNAGGAVPNLLAVIDPAPDVAFTTTEIHRRQVWGGQDAVVGTNGVLPPHASGVNGVYLAAQCCEAFQGRIVAGNVILCPKYTVAGDIANPFGYSQKRTRLIWTILPGEYPSRGQYTTNSDGLTHLQWPWCVEENNYVDIDGIGSIYAICNMGDNQLFIVGSDGCGRLTGYLSTAVAGINAATYDARKIMRSPGGVGPGCAVVCSHGVFFTDGETVYQYDGNSITDVLYGAARYAFHQISGGKIPANCGIIDDDHVYFGNGPLLVYNHTHRKWSYMGNIASNIGQSVQKGKFIGYPIPGGGASPCNTGGLSVSPPSRNLATGRDLGRGAPSGQTQGEDYWIALRPYGSAGIPKRFRHVNVHYGFATQSPTNLPVVNVRALYGADKGWPDILYPIDIPLIGTLPLTHPVPAVANLGVGSVPTKTVRISIDDATLMNFAQDGQLDMGWPDTIALFFQLVYGSVDTYTYFRIYSVDVSYIERPGAGHLVMGAA